MPQDIYGITMQNVKRLDSQTDLKENQTMRIKMAIKYQNADHACKNGVCPPLYKCIIIIRYYRRDIKLNGSKDSFYKEVFNAQ